MSKRSTAAVALANKLDRVHGISLEVLDSPMSRPPVPVIGGFVCAAACAGLIAAAISGPVEGAITGDLQAALDRARPGDVILLDPTAEYVGNFVLPAKEGDGYITIQTAIDPARVVGPDGRIQPEEADLLATIRSPNAAAAISTAPGAHHWRLRWLEIAGSGGGDLIRLGDGSRAQNRMDDVPHHLVIDGCYIHGHPTAGQKRGVALNSATTAIVNSHISSIGRVGQETQAIAGWNGPGPYVIENNYLEAAGINFMLGGADPAIHGLVPADATIRRNHFAKRLAWRGGQWPVKNLLELKSARNVRIEWNLFEYNWLHAQAGSAIVLKSWNQEGGAPWSVVEDVAIRYNVIRHVGSAFNLLGRSYDHPAEIARRITIEQNLVYDVSAEKWGGHGRFMLVGDGPEAITVDRNTVIQDGSFVQVYGSANEQPLPVRGFRLTSNLALHNEYGIKGDSRAVGRDTLSAYFPNATVRGNVLAGGPKDRYPAGNFFPDVDEFLEQFEDPTAEDYRLKANSRFRQMGSDGSAAGADVEYLLRCLGSAGRAPRESPRRLDPVRERSRPPHIGAGECPQPTDLPD
jgi:hypothetical protein